MTVEDIFFAITKKYFALLTYTFLITVFKHTCANTVLKNFCFFDSFRGKKNVYIITGLELRFNEKPFMTL